MRDGCLNRDGANYAVVHCTGYIKNWPPQGIQLDRSQEDEMHAASSCCLVAIGRLQVSSSHHWSPLGRFLTPIGCLLVGR
jgi:aryl hydrocarbon receptor nuclear translocator